jgi:RNA recognition motif-containing protein
MFNNYFDGVFCMNIYIGNLPYKTEESDIKTLFEQFGDVQSVKLITDKSTGRKKGFGFVEMDDTAGQSAIDKLNEMEFMGRNLKVNMAKFDKEPTDRPPRRSGSNNR